ncbi:MAG: glycosyltransferase [Paludibacter sp.]|nr:glycosyltransferase [Paludibacter sp.]
MHNSIEIVIVLYQCSLDKSITFLSLTEQLENFSVDYELVIYNNDINQKIEDSRFLIVNSEENKKLEGAYNFALDRAIKNGKNWILLLDQDTVIPGNYFEELQKLFSSNYSLDLVAIVPKLVSENKVISPVRVTSFMRFEKELHVSGYTNERINALNSLSLFKVQFIESIGGFSKDFPFDMHDHWCYNQVYKHQKKVYVLDVTTIHESSFVNFEENISLQRYKEFLTNENRFIRAEIGMPVYLFYKMKILVRSFRQFVKFKNKKYAMITLKSFF